MAAVDDFMEFPPSERATRELPVDDAFVDAFLARERPNLAPKSVRSFTWAVSLEATPEGEVMPPMIVNTKPEFQDVYPGITREQFVGDVASTFDGYELAGDPYEGFRDSLLAEHPKSCVTFHMTKLLSNAEDPEELESQLANVVIAGHLAYRYRTEDGGSRALWIGETFDASEKFRLRWQRYAPPRPAPPRPVRNAASNAASLQG
eukprot:scaffold535_cov260-Pinguiococcus_pyrenoidosus.AAC.29